MKAEPGPATTFSKEIPAEARNCRETARQVRAFLAVWLKSVQILDDLELVVTEALANTAHHAYTDQPAGKAAVEVVVHPGSHVELKLSDWGCKLKPEDFANGLPPEDSPCGRGLYLIRHLLDGIDIRSGGGRCDMLGRKDVENDAWIHKPGRTETSSS